MTENFPKIQKDIKSQIQNLREPQEKQSPSTTDIPKHTRCEFLKTKDERQIQRNSEKKDTLWRNKDPYYHKLLIRNMQTRKQ